MSEERKIRNDIVALGLLAMIVFLVAALATNDPADPAFRASSLLNNAYQPDQLHYPARAEFHNACGPIGAWTSDMLINTLGIGAYFLIVGLISMEIALFKRQSFTAPWAKTTGWVFSLLALTTLSAMLLPDRLFSSLIGPGGYMGALGNGLLRAHLGMVGTLIITVTLFLAGTMMWTEYLVFRAGRLVFSPALVAGSAVLPFGITYRFMSWVNRTEVNSSLDLDESDEPQAEESNSTETDSKESEDEQAFPRTIRFRRRELDDVEDDANDANDANDKIEEEDSEYESVATADSEEDGEFETEDTDDEPIEDEDFETIGKLPTTLKISSATKEPDPSLEEPEDEEVAASSAPIPKPHFKIRKPPEKKEPTQRELVMNQLNEVAETDEMVDYELPKIEMLEKGSAIPFEQQQRDSLAKARVLESTCKEFGYDVEVVEIEVGPVISQYEIELAPGLRLQKITALADDLAIAMRVPSVRIVAPIPGKNSVGVEVPNQSRQTVHLRQVMEQAQKQIKSMKIPLFLGSDAVGAPMVADLAKLPHLLIAGRTGTGKSVCLNAIIASILMTRRPDEVRMIMIDPKMVELSGYARLPHLMHPVVTDMRKAEAILAWACEKMDERYALLARAGVRHVTTYNDLGHEELMDRLKPVSDEERANIPGHMPFIVIVADEIADLMMTSGKEVEQHIIRLAQKSRAVGIHLILATQKPTVDVITGLIKSNLPARIAFQVASKTDSRVVLDAQGADKLLGMGDMLFLWPGTSMLLRGQGTFLSDPEIDMITETVSSGEQNFVHELVNIKVKTEDGEEEEGDEPRKLENRDALYEEAISVVVREQRGSCSLLQRSMGIGYGRAARLIDFMAEDGYVGPYNGSKAREVMLSEEQWNNIQAGDPNPVNDEDWPDDDSDADAKVTLKSTEAPAPRKPKKLQRVEPGTTSHLSANVSFPRKKRSVKPEEPEEEVEEELEDDVENVDTNTDDDISDSDPDDLEVDDADGEEYDEVDYEEEEEEENDESEADEYEEEEDDEEYEDVD